MYFPLFVGVLCLSLFCYALLSVHLEEVSRRYVVAVIGHWFFLTAPLVGLQCVIVVFPDHTHLLFAMN